MTKREFIAELEKRLAGLPRQDVEERLNFYEEMIDDRIEDGHSEEDAVAKIGSVDEIAAQIVSEPPRETVKNTAAPKRKIKAWEIILLVLGSPVWVSILIAVFAVVSSLYVTTWALIICFWAIFAALVASAPCLAVEGIVNCFSVGVLDGVNMIAVGLICAGLAVFTFYGCIAATRGAIRLTVKTFEFIKNRFVGTEA